MNFLWQDVDVNPVFDTFPVGIIITDFKGKILFWNQAMTKLTGFSREDALGKSCSIISCQSRGGKDFAARCPLASGQADSVPPLECRIQHASGTQIPVLIHANLLRNHDGRKLAIIRTFTDLSPIQNLENAIAEIRSKQPKPETEASRIIGESPAIREVFKRIRLAANSDANILILGETGTGKELVAEEIHRLSRRAGAPLVKVNCSAFPETLMESELFGHVKGAFTGAVRDYRGRFEVADGGTIFLDEIGDISPLIQLKLLRVIQEKTIERLGDNKPIRVDVRIIAATHKDLKQLVLDGSFRQDLYYRLCVYPIIVPPLRERRDDIPLLVDYFIERFRKETGKNIRGLSPGALQTLMSACFPGNVRELENAIEHAFVACEEEVITPEHLPIDIRIPAVRDFECQNLSSRYAYLLEHPSQGKPVSNAAGGEAPQSRPEPPAGQPPETPEELLALLERFHWNKAKIAQYCGISRVTVWRKMKQWNLPPQPPNAL